jgi:hypothetical protein
MEELEVELVLQAGNGSSPAKRRAVVNDPEHAARFFVGRSSHDLFDQQAKGAMPVLDSQRPKTRA